jgi:glycosyltransferase involved in cell wall biosynthesis
VLIFILRRLMQSLFVLLAVSLVVFFAVYAVGDPIELLVSAEASEADRQAMIRRLGLADHVQYTGPLDAAAMRQAYLDADLFLLPSYSENSPNSLGEAMLLGLPCVASAAGGIPDMLQSGVQGMLYGAAGDDAALSAAILQLLALPDHGTALGTAAQIRARVTHDAAKNTAQMIKIYRKVLQREGTL